VIASALPRLLRGVPRDSRERLEGPQVSDLDVRASGCLAGGSAGAEAPALHSMRGAPDEPARVVILAGPKPGATLSGQATCAGSRWEMGVRGMGLVPVSDSPFCCGAISGSYLRFIYNEVDLLVLQQHPVILRGVAS
jgi:hypothetical protein